MPAVLLLRSLSTSLKSTLLELEKLEIVKAHVALSNRGIVYRDKTCEIKGIRFIMNIQVRGLNKVDNKIENSA